MKIKEVLSKYFTNEELGKVDTIASFPDDKSVEIGGIKYKLQGDNLILDEFPAKYGFEIDASKDENFKTWESVAFIKVRIINTGTEIVEKARTGALYDESYYTLRGGGSPYIQYPNNFYGFSEEDRFKDLGTEILEKYGKSKILDCGCATGSFVNQLQLLGFDGYGFDISEYAIKHAVCSNLFHADGRNLPFGDNEFDILVSQDYMEHIHPDDLPKVLEEQKRILKPGGVALHFIPFYKEYDEPVQIDAHLCNASRKWWASFFKKSAILEMEYAPAEDNQWDYSNGILIKYFVLRKKLN
jgi:SAM-dependent methyltransferase